MWARNSPFNLRLGGSVGLHICLDKKGEDHPSWDYIRQGNDSRFPCLIDYHKTTPHPTRNGYFRPTNIKELRQQILDTDWDDKGRYLHLINLLETDQDTWLMFSY